MDGQILTERLLAYAEAKLGLDPLDKIYLRNALLRALGLVAPTAEPVPTRDVAAMTVPDALIEELKTYAVNAGLCEAEAAERFAVAIFGMLSPLPSEVNRKFLALRERDPQAACDWLYRLSIDNFYIQKTAIDRNLKWDAEDGANTLEITINLSKPEKDNKDIAKLLTAKKEASKYPACLLCKENEGFEGTPSHPARGNLRTVGVKLGGQDWFMQYSPYAYYDEHCIVINKEHTPMRVNASTVDKLLDFADWLPNYFIGSNASLPIVGGSILNHEHFQGGRHLMPMHKASVREWFVWDKFASVKVGVLDWYNSVVRFESTDRAAIAAAASETIEFWNGYDDPSAQILSRTGDVRHNAVTPILRKVDDTYLLDLILRNNRCDETFPDGIFHAHPEYHNIKKEGIGIIEVMGLFILPGRLKRQLGEIEDVLCGRAPYDAAAIATEGHDLYVHRDMIARLRAEHPDVRSKEQAHAIVVETVNATCRGVLYNTAVFKTAEPFAAFLRALGCQTRS